MTRILFFLLLISSMASGQVKQIYNQYGGQWKRLQADSALRIPLISVGVRNSNAGLDTGQIRYNIGDSSVKVYTGYQWRDLGGSGGSGQNFGEADTLLTANRYVNLDSNTFSFKNGTVAFGANKEIIGNERVLINEFNAYKELQKAERDAKC